MEDAFMMGFAAGLEKIAAEKDEDEKKKERKGSYKKALTRGALLGGVLGAGTGAAMMGGKHRPAAFHKGEMTIEPKKGPKRSVTTKKKGVVTLKQGRGVVVTGKKKHPVYETKQYRPKYKKQGAGWRILRGGLGAGAGAGIGAGAGALGAAIDRWRVGE